MTMSIERVFLQVNDIEHVILNVKAQSDDIRRGVCPCTEQPSHGGFMTQVRSPRSFELKMPFCYFLMSSLLLPGKATKLDQPQSLTLTA